MRGTGTFRRLGAAAALGLCLSAGGALAQEPPAAEAGEPAVEEAGGMVQLDFNDVELNVVIDTIARLTGKNFIYDDKVRGRVTIVSPTRITVDQAYAVFESVLQVKGFTTVEGPGGALRIVPIRDAKEQSIETSRGEPPASDRFVTRLIPLQYIDAEAIANTLKPLVSKDAAMVAYAPTNTVILTDSASNIARILDIISAIDVETYREELTVIKVRHGDAATLAQQITEIYGGEVTGAGVAPGAARTPAARARRAQQAAQAGITAVTAEAVAKGVPRIITDDRTNSLIVLASRARLEDIRRLVAKLDVPVTGGGRIHVYYVKHADADELAQTLSSLVSGSPRTPRAQTSGTRGRTPQERSSRTSPASAQTPAAQALAAQVSELSEGVTITADPGTNSLVIQASQEGYRTILEVIEQLDIPRPQVLVEALIMEVNVSDNEELGFNGIARVFRGDTSYGFGTVTDAGGTPALFGTPTVGGGEDTDGDGVADTAGTLTGGPGTLTDTILSNLIGTVTRNTLDIDPVTGAIMGGTLIQGIIRANALNSGTNILSSPHILTSDNEEAEIHIGNEIPIVTSRVQSAAGIETADTSLATSQNIERQDIGITLRVTPQITEGNNLRLKIFQEITGIDLGLTATVGDPQEVGVALTKRKVENNVVVSDHETVVIGGLISTNYQDSVNKVPWLGDIPILGWAFKSTTQQVLKNNLLIFLTPHVVRSVNDHEIQTIRKREEFRAESKEAIELTESQKEEAEQRRQEMGELGLTWDETESRNPVRSRILRHEKRYPVERMKEIEEEEKAEVERKRAEAEAALHAPRFAVVAAVFRDAAAAAETLTEIIDSGYDGTLESTTGANGTVLTQIRLGPYKTREEAERVADVVRQAFGLSPTVATVGEDAP
jgi:general secretion pathway protein D